MKKFNLLLLFITYFSLTGYSQYQISTPLTALTSPAGASVSLSVTPTKAPAGNGTITLYYQGDFDGSNETADLFDENNILIGTTASGVTQCSATLDSVQFPVTASQISSWMANQVIGFTIVPENTVNPTLCPATGDNVKIKLSYPPVTGPNDIGISRIDIGSGSTFCPGTQNITATIMNAGTNQVTSATVYWELNGVSQTSYNFTGLLDTLGGTGSQTTVVNLGSYNFTSGATNIKAYTSMPNRAADTSNVNDTLTKISGPSLSGVFSINSASPSAGTNYASFGDFINDLSSFGVCGPITVNVVSNSGPYNEQVNFIGISGTNATNTITINGNGNILQFASTNSN